MSDVWIARVNRFVEKLFNVKGGPTLVDVDPSVRVNLPWKSGVEDRYLQGWNLYHGSVAIGAVAAQFSRVLLRNPIGSNMLFVLESLSSPGNALDMAVVTQSTNLTTVVGGVLSRLDARSTFSQSVAVLSFDTNATQTPGAATVLIKRSSGADFVHYEDEQIPILPGDGIWVVSDVVNVSIQVNLRWRERPIEPSESS